MKKGLNKTATARSGVGARPAPVSTKMSTKSSNGKGASFTLHSSNSTASLAHPRQANHFLDNSRPLSHIGTSKASQGKTMHKQNNSILTGTTAMHSGLASPSSAFNKHCQGMYSFG